MKIDDLRTMRNRVPFRAFQLHLTSGEILDVAHPEQMSLTDDEKEMFVVWTKEGWNLVDASRVERISVQRRSSK